MEPDELMAGNPASIEDFAHALGRERVKFANGLEFFVDLFEPGSYEFYEQLAVEVGKLEDLYATIEEEFRREDLASTTQWSADARTRGLLTLREALAKWNREHPEDPITVDNLDADDRANLDVRGYHPIAEVSEESREILRGLGKLPARERDER